MDRAALRALARSRNLVRPSPTTRPILLLPVWTPTPTATRAVSTVPRIAEVSFWKSLVPKPLRRENRRVRDPSAPKTPWLAREWNPATFFIIIFLLIGSMSIQMISLRSNFEAFTRRADVRIGLLREVVERIQKGEKVDVEKVLGSGDAEREAVWEEVLNEIEKDSAARNQKKQEKQRATASPPTTPQTVSTSEPRAGSMPVQEPSKGRPADFF